MLFCFCLFLYCRAPTSTVEKMENFLGKTTVCRPKNVFGFTDESNGS